jgi:hypothetical protein
VPRTRRNPRYVAFLGTGAVLGLVTAFVLALGPGADVEDPRRLLAYLCALLAGLGALLGGALAVLLEGRRR